MKGALIRILGAAALLLSGPGFAQTPVSPTKPWTQIGDANGNALGTSVNPIYVSGGSGGGGGGAVTIADGADTAEGATSAAAYTDTTGAAAGTLTALNKGQYVKAEQIRALLAAPLTISNSTFGATQSGTWTVNLTNGSTGAVWGTTSSDAIAASSTAGFLGTNAYGRVFNGTSWDRARGDTTGGAWVQEKERSLYYTETATPLAANAAFTGATRDGGASPSQWASFTCFFSTDQASTSNSAQLQGSSDGTTWFTMLKATIAGSTPLVQKTQVSERYHRCIMTNSTTAQALLIINSVYGAN